jgi:MerR family transcriptional regulator, mercuric resistance operon regulatory protein
MSQQPMTIGALAKAAGVNVETVRYYQRRGLIPTPTKSLGGQRRYPESVLHQITFIRRGQTLGFTLEEIAKLLDLVGSRDCKTGRAMAEKKVLEIATRMAELKRMSRQLELLVEQCNANRTGKPCPVIAHLQGDGD